MYIKYALGEELVYQCYVHICIEAYLDTRYVGDKGD